MKTTVVHALFNNHAAADRAYQALLVEGFDKDDISVLTRAEALETMDKEKEPSAADAAEGAGLGALAGGATGGLLGVLAGIGAIAIPGLGPVLATGAASAALASAMGGAGVGAAVGGIVGAASALAIPEEEAHVYAEGIRQGGVLVVVDTPEAQAGTARAVLEQNGALDTERIQAAWRERGWEKYSPDAQETTLPLTFEDLEEDARTDW